MGKLIKHIILLAVSVGIFLFTGIQNSRAVGQAPLDRLRHLTGQADHSSHQSLFQVPGSPRNVVFGVQFPSRSESTPKNSGRLPDPIARSAFSGCGDKKVGEIAPGYSHAWGENVGWVNFRPEGAKLEIGGNILAGWIEIKTLGWVYLGDGKPSNGYQYSNASASDYGVNNKEGNLSGYAWSENVGWISFHGVTIYKEGNFSGYAWSENVGRLKFESEGSAEYMVKTDPYPWKEIGVREEIKLGSGSYPSGDESIGVSSGVSEFTIPSPSASLDFYSGEGEETIEDELVLGFEDNEKRIDFKIDDKTRNARGPPEIEKINLKIYSDSDVGTLFNHDNKALPHFFQGNTLTWL